MRINYYFIWGRELQDEGRKVRVRLYHAVLRRYSVVSTKINSAIGIGRIGLFLPRMQWIQIPESWRFHVIKRVGLFIIGRGKTLDLQPPRPR
jgi:hypothetical protein